MSYLLDTNVISETRRRSPDPGVLDWLGGIVSHELHLSVLTIGEIRNGVERLRRKDSRGAARLDVWLRTVVRDYAERIVDVDAEIADRWGRLNAKDPVPVVDGLLAATALVHDWTLVTRNVGDVVRTGVRMHNPFAS